MAVDFEARRRAQEQLILLVLGEVQDREMSVLHLQKEVFILWKSHPSIPKFIEFAAYQHGPYAEEINDAIHSPYYLTEAWEYRKETKNDKYSSGFVRLTESGKETYTATYQRLLADEKMHSLLTGIYIVRKLYDKYTPEELIYLIYETYPDYKVNSEIANEIYARKKLLSERIEKASLVSEPAVSYTHQKVVRK